MNGGRNRHVSGKKLFLTENMPIYIEGTKAGGQSHICWQRVLLTGS